MSDLAHGAHPQAGIDHVGQPKPLRIFVPRGDHPVTVSVSGVARAQQALLDAGFIHLIDELLDGGTALHTFA